MKPKLNNESDVRVQDINVRSAAINVFITGRFGGTSWTPSGSLSTCRLCAK